jgi:hypothetical protein
MQHQIGTAVCEGSRNHSAEHTGRAGNDGKIAAKVNRQHKVSPFDLDIAPAISL